MLYFLLNLVMSVFWALAILKLCSEIIVICSMSWHSFVHAHLLAVFLLQCVFQRFWLVQSKSQHVLGESSYNSDDTNFTILFCEVKPTTKCSSIYTVQNGQRKSSQILLFGGYLFICLFLCLSVFLYVSKFSNSLKGKNGFQDINSLQDFHLSD